MQFQHIVASTVMAPKVAPPAAIVPGAPRDRRLPPTRRARHTEKASFEPIAMPNPLRNLIVHGRFLPNRAMGVQVALREDEAELCAFYLLHTSKRIRDDIFVRFMTQCSPLACSRLRYHYNREARRMEVKIKDRTGARQGPNPAQGPAVPSVGVIACDMHGVVHG